MNLEHISTLHVQGTKNSTEKRQIS